MAPSSPLLGVPSRSISRASTPAWSEASSPSSSGAIRSVTLATAVSTPLPPKRDLSPSRSSTASCAPVEAPLGTAARPTEPSSRTTSTSMVGLPRESRISRASMKSIVVTRASPSWRRPCWRQAWSPGRGSWAEAFAAGFAEAALAAAFAAGLGRWLRGGLGRGLGRRRLGRGLGSRGLAAGFAAALAAGFDAGPRRWLRGRLGGGLRGRLRGGLRGSALARGLRGRLGGSFRVSQPWQLVSRPRLSRLAGLAVGLRRGLDRRLRRGLRRRRGRGLLHRLRLRGPIQQHRHARQLASLEELERRAATRRDVRHLVGEPLLGDRRHGVAAADHDRRPMLGPIREQPRHGVRAMGERRDLEHPQWSVPEHRLRRRRVPRP